MAKARLSVPPGISRLLDELAERGQRVGPAVDRALAAGAAVALDGMQERVPKDTHNLEQHLTVSPPRTDGGYHYVEVGLLGPGLDAETSRYGNVQEFGAADTPAQPYVRPTMQEDATKIRRAQLDEFQKELS